jgi:hypothetical protein
MNIFVLSQQPALAARMQCDRHVVKMILESAQMLSTAHRVIDNVETLPNFYTNEPVELYKKTHENHPCSVWLRESSANYAWLYSHFIWLGQEYTLRYGKVHKTIEKLAPALTWQPKFIRKTYRTAFAQAMPEQYRDADAVTAYRNYYIAEKSKIAKWNKGRLPPHWWPENNDDQSENKTLLLSNSEV